ncbi:MAG: putative metal-dependent hydrolase [Flavobacteriales bacterium]|nr:putative metal-dependent hydrolase [Flavobacteriales bacterium]
MNTIKKDLRFPIGEFIKPTSLDLPTRSKYIEIIADFHSKMVQISSGLKEELNWRYRPDGWTIAQVIHHCSDSHMNALIRFKLTLTEDSPTIRPYFEDRWAELADTLESNIENPLEIIKGVHNRWTILLNSMKNSDFEKHYVHPELGETYTLDQALANYEWHCRHHFAHIEQALEHKGEFN